MENLKESIVSFFTQAKATKTTVQTRTEDIQNNDEYYTPNKAYNNSKIFSTDKTDGIYPTTLINDSRDVAEHPIVELCLDEIVGELSSDSVLVRKSFPSFPSLVLNENELSDAQIKTITDAYNHIGNIMGDVTGLFRDFLIDGALAVEVVYTSDNKSIVSYNVLDVSKLKYYQGTLKNAVYELASDNSILGGFDSNSSNIYSKEQLITFKLNNTRRYRTAISSSIKSVNRMAGIEDAISQYRLMRGQDRRMYGVPIGNMNVTSADTYIRKVARMLKSSLRFNDNGKIVNEGSSSLVSEDYILPTRKGEQITVDTLEGGDSSYYNELNDYELFKDHLYSSMKIPRNRLDSESQKTATEVLKEELKFAKYVATLTSSFSKLIEMMVFRELVAGGRFIESEYNDIKKHIKYEYNLGTGTLHDIKLLTFSSTVDIYQDAINADVHEFIPKDVMFKDMFNVTDEQMEEWKEIGTKNGTLLNDE